MMSKFSTQHHIIGMMSIMMCTHVDCFLIIKQAANIHNLWSTFVSCWFFFSSVFLFVFWYYLLSWMGIFLRKMLVISTRQEDYIFQPNSWEVLISITGDFSLPVSFSLLPPFPSLSLSLSLSHPLSLPPSLLSPFLTLSTSLSPSLSPLSLTPSLCLSPLPPSLSFPPSLSPSFLCLPPFLSGPSPSLSYPPSLHPVWLSPPLPLSLCVHLFFLSHSFEMETGRGGHCPNQGENLPLQNTMSAVSSALCHATASTSFRRWGLFQLCLNFVTCASLLPW